MTDRRTHTRQEGNGLPQTIFWGGHGMYLKASISSVIMSLGELKHLPVTESMFLEKQCFGVTSVSCEDQTGLR